MEGDKWRLIGPERLAPELTLALDEVMLKGVSEGGAPTLRFWTWSRCAVTLGSFQVASDEVYLDRCKEDGVPVLRRISGGGCMFHAPDKEVVYSMAVPSSEVPASITDSYAALQAPVLKALVDLGVRASVLDNSLMVGQGKVSGSSQRRIRGAVLHHGTLLLDVDRDEMFRYIKGDRAVKNGKGTPSNYRPVVPLGESADVGPEKLSAAVARRFLEGKEHQRSEWNMKELGAAHGLVHDKYATDEWNLRL